MDSHEIKHTAKGVMQSVVEYLQDDSVRTTQVISIRTVPKSEQKLLVKMFNHWMHKNRETVFILADSTLSLQIIEQHLNAKYGGIRIVGTAVLEEKGISDDKILNRINGAEPGCIIVSLPKDMEELFVGSNRMSLNAKVWFGFGCRKEWPKERSGMPRFKELFSGVLRKKE